ncbi:rRNA adenine N-6-methyltransferase family protein [Bacillus sp. E(2018)]|uniref:class I SAM-dependent methyltransferase n=1 Tax=Bacillus sp. E(2018) TaxID=2502239 RepID=UPI0010F7709D|nr:rRNA adenine N-6-methyltransferase family protein [Bacillus sp. E(2018)]
MTSLKQSFNFVADSYEKYRPTYPQKLFKDIIRYANLDEDHTLLEVGSGTGKATEGFVKEGISSITCVEYGKNLVQLTQRKFSSYPHLQVIHSSFEDWHHPEKVKYNLVFSGTAFHFIPHESGYQKAASLLKDDGVLALFWFVHIPSHEPVYESIRKAYASFAPHLEDSLAPTLADFIEKRNKQTLESGAFQDLQTHTYTWDQTYTAEEYVGLLDTHSGHQLLAPEQKGLLYQEIRKAILAQNSGVITKTHAVALFLAKKK